MIWASRRLETLATWVVLVAWVAFYVVALANADPLPGPVAAVVQLVVPALLGVLATRLALRHWWSGDGSRTPAMDLPSRLLAAAVAARPERRQEWGSASDWPVLAILSGAVVVASAVSGWAAGTAVPGLTVFAGAFTGLLGALVVLAVARRRRLQVLTLAPTVLVIGGVAVSIAATVVFLRREPAAAQYLSPPAAVHLAVGLAGCLWIAVAPPRWLVAGRLAPHLGAAAAVVFAAWFLLWNRTDGTRPPLPLVLMLAAVLILVPLAAFVIPAFAAGRVGRSLRSGLQAAVWTVTAVMPLTYALWLPEALRRHGIDGRTLDGELVAPVGVNLADAVIFCFGIFPVFGLTLGVIGAALGANTSRQRES